MKRDATPTATPDETPVLRVEVEGLKTQLAMMRDQLDDIRAQRDLWQKQADSAHRLLTDARSVRRSWFGWRRG